jgi:hypothetical protein
MKVKILHGNQAGQIIEQAQSEAESNIATGYACAVEEDSSPASEAEPEKPKDEAKT